MNVQRAEENLNSIGAGLAGTFRQKDTYFRALSGRLKLREISPDEGQVVYYERSDVAGPKRSDYEVASTSDPLSMRIVLKNIFGISVEVKKTRQVWLWENVRIHLDNVKDLGHFVELEALTEEQGIGESQSRIETLMRALEISNDDLVKGSYGDLLGDKT
jgi:predicted adenylyl cyclase CyaB